MLVWGSLTADTLLYSSRTLARQERAELFPRPEPRVLCLFEQHYVVLIVVKLRCEMCS